MTPPKVFLLLIIGGRGSTFPLNFFFTLYKPLGAKPLEARCEAASVQQKVNLGPSVARHIWKAFYLDVPILFKLICICSILCFFYLSKFGYYKIIIYVILNFLKDL